VAILSHPTTLNLTQQKPNQPTQPNTRSINQSINQSGGWNNVRMAMETVATLAHATGRTLVMPPNEAMYLISKVRRMDILVHLFPLA
jgi:hypothetical protein